MLATTRIDTPFPITDDVHKVGWLAGVYAQDEWKITDKLTMNAGLRFDQMWQFVNANQLSPRASLTYKPFEGTTFHAGYARYFTPPVLVEAAPANFNLFNNTTAAVANRDRQSAVAGAVALFRRRASIRRFFSDAYSASQKTAARSISASTPITRSQRT